MAKKRKGSKFTPRKRRVGFVLYCEDSPFRAKIVRNKKAYNRKKTLDISEYLW